MPDLFGRYIAATPTKNTSTEGPGSKVDSTVPPAKKEEQKQETLPTPVANEVAGEPGVVLGDFGQKFRVLPNVNNKQGIPITGRIVGDIDNTGLESFNIEINNAHHGREAGKLTPEELNLAVENRRTLHMMKFILDNNLDRNVGDNPTAQETEDAISMFDTFGSKNSSRITKAYALVSRALTQNPSAKADMSSLLLLNNAFKRTGQSVVTYFRDGENISRNEELPATTPAEQLKAKRDTDIANFTARSTNPASKYQSRFEGRIRDLERRIELLTASKAGLRGDNPEIKKINSEIDQLNSNRTSYVSQQDAEYRVWKDEQDAIAKTMVDHSSRIATYNATLANLDEADKTEKVFIDAYKAEKPSWVGTGSNDDTKFNGWIAEGVADWYQRAPRAVVRGKSIPMLPADYLDWVERGGKYRDYQRRTAGMNLPSPKVLEEVIQLTSDQDKLVSPMQELFFKFDKLSKGGFWGDASPLKKFFSAEFAAEENNVFHIMAARRKFVTGGGNPSNYEQDMLLSGIPNPGKLWTVAELNKERIRTISYLTLLDHARYMQKSGFRITNSAINHYNQRYSKIMGYEITAADINRHMHVIDTFGIGDRQTGFVVGSESDKRAYSHFEKFHDLLQLEDEKRRAGK